MYSWAFLLDLFIQVVSELLLCQIFWQWGMKSKTDPKDSIVNDSLKTSKSSSFQSIVVENDKETT